MSTVYITHHGQEYKLEVKNLGWLLAHASEATDITVMAGPVAGMAWLVVEGARANGITWRYQTTFADITICRTFVMRRALAHCKLTDMTATTPALNIGARVELGPHLDRWMMGDRFGTVVARGTSDHRAYVRVALDRSGQTRSFRPLDLTAVA